MLDHLAVLTHAAAAIGKEQRQNAFGHLVVLLRDVSPKYEENAGRLLFEEEDATSATTHDEEQHMLARNENRNLLRSSFNSVRVVCLPRPHSDIEGKMII